MELPGEVEDSLRRLGRHYIPARYPDAHPAGPPSTHYGAADSDEATRDAQTLLLLVDRL
jgi:HEPN domain-containing protein